MESRRKSRNGNLKEKNKCQGRRDHRKLEKAVKGAEDNKRITGKNKTIKTNTETG